MAIECGHPLYDVIIEQNKKIIILIITILDRYSVEDLFKISSCLTTVPFKVTFDNSEGEKCALATGKLLSFSYMNIYRLDRGLYFPNSVTLPVSIMLLLTGCELRVVLHCFSIKWN